MYFNSDNMAGFVGLFFLAFFGIVLMAAARSCHSHLPVSTEDAVYERTEATPLRHGAAEAVEAVRAAPAAPLQAASDQPDS